MISPTGLSGYKAIVYDRENKSVIAETRILSFEESNGTLTLRASAFTSFPESVSVLLLDGATAPREYLGTVRKSSVSSDSIEIGLYKGKTKEERATVRYPVNIDATVDYFVIARKLVPLRNMLKVLVINLSSTGCLISGDGRFFNIGATFRISMKLEETPLLLYANVVRVTWVDANTAEYGCKFIFPETEQK